MRRAGAVGVVLLLAVGCGDELTAATSEGEGSSSETGGPSSETDSEGESGEVGDGDGDTTSDETEAGETETGETGEEPIDPDAQDACPDGGCLCLTEPTEIERAPELHGELVDLNGDGWLDEVYFSNQGWPIVFLDGHLFSARMGTGEGTFEDEGTYGPLLPERFSVVTHVATGDFDGDGALDIVANEHGLVFVPNAELFEDVLIEHHSPLLGYVPAMTTGTLPGESGASVFVTYSYYNLAAIDGGAAMIWERYVPLDGSPPISLEFLYAVCATGDHTWTLGELPLWAGGERFRLADWVVRDGDGQLGEDLSIRSYEEVDGEFVRYESRMLRQ